MYNWEKMQRDRRYRHENQNPSFSSSLLDKIYRSIDEVEPKPRVDELRFRRETTVKKQSKSWALEEEAVLSLRQACLLDKWMEKNAKQKLSLRQSHQFWSEIDKKSSKLDHDYDRHDALFFSSGSNSSESSSGGFSSSDTESYYNPKPSNSCFSRPKQIRVGSEKPERKQRTLFYEQSELHVLDDYHFKPTASDQNTTPKSKSRTSKIYGNLKNLKQPISPGGRLAGFLNSIFTINTKKSKNTPRTHELGTERVSKSVQQQSTCSSASSFSRSCLSKNSPATREKSRDGVKRSVRFCPVSVIVDQDLRPCGQKSLSEEKQELKLMSVSVPNSRNTSRRNDVVDTELMKLRSRRVEEAARDFLKQYRQKQSKRSGFDRYDENQRLGDAEEEVEDDDASCASSDLFELDHLSVIGGERYREELPVYETTRVDRNRVIANGLFM